MIVLTRQSRPEWGRWWFLVAPLTSQGREATGTPRPDVQPIGTCVEPDRESFVKVGPTHRLPDNLISRKPGKPAIVKPCDPFGFRNALKVIERRMLGWSKIE